MLGLVEFESIDETSMSAETQLREKLHKIEALFAGAGTAGERLAAGAALERVKARLAELGQRDSAVSCSNYHWPSLRARLLSHYRAI